jgi:anti-sigma B factor antagonist
VAITLRHEGNITILTLSGRFDALMAKEFKNSMAKLIETPQVKIVLDMTAVDFIDSSGLGALVGSMKGVAKEQGEIRIAGLTREVHTIFELTRLHRIFDIFESLDASLVAF